MKEILSLKNIIILGLIVIIFLLRVCEPNTVLPQPKEIVKVERHIDTVLVQGNPDTVYFPKYIDRYIEVPVYGPVVDTLGLVATYDYSNIYEDSLITGVISTLVTEEGEMLSQELFYTPLFPKYIYRTDTMKIKDSVYVEKTKFPDPKRSLLFHSGIGLSETSASLRVGLGLRTKKGTDFIYGYDIINNQHNVGVSIPLTK